MPWHPLGVAARATTARLPLPPCPACLATYHSVPTPLPASAGYLPSFWIKLRLMAAPAANSGAIAAAIPAVLGGPTHLTVGLLAAFVAVACIIAADTGAYFTGKSFGRTQVRGGAGGRLGGRACFLPACWAACSCRRACAERWRRGAGHRSVRWLGMAVPCALCIPLLPAAPPPCAADACEPQEDGGGCGGRPAEQHRRGAGPVPGARGGRARRVLLCSRARYKQIADWRALTAMIALHCGPNKHSGVACHEHAGWPVAPQRGASWPQPARVMLPSPAGHLACRPLAGRTTR